MFLVTCHYGTWAVAGYITGLTEHRTYAIAPELDNPPLSRFLKQLRPTTGQTILAQRADEHPLRRRLQGDGQEAPHRATAARTPGLVRARALAVQPGPGLLARVDQPVVGALQIPFECAFRFA